VDGNVLFDPDGNPYDQAALNELKKEYKDFVGAALV
jgi:hypothetical protein